MAAISIEHNRRAVYDALSRSLDDRSLVERAFSHFETEFARSKLFRVSQYIDSLVKDIGLQDAQRRKISVALYAALAKKELPELPTTFQRVVEADSLEKTTVESRAQILIGDTAQDRVFIALADKLLTSCAGAAEDGLAEVREVFNDFAKETEISKPGREACSTWSGQDFDPSSAPQRLSSEDMHAVVHVLYLSACEIAGPTKADRLLTSAARAVSSLPDADEFDPHQLL